MFNNNQCVQEAGKAIKENEEAMSHFFKALHSTGDAPATTGRTIRWAYAYDFVVRVLTLNRESALRAETIRLAGIERGATVLDVGCGTGSITLRAAALTGAEGRVYGIDAAPEMIAAARRKAHTAGVQVNFQVGVIEGLDFADATFDRVLSSLMMHHLPHELKGQALTEVYRVLKPGGQLLIVDFDASVPRSRFARLHHWRAAARPADLVQLVRQAGFADVEAGRLTSAPVGFVRGTHS
jgi:demethylmenaquinone methyltransferase/2-methoxy-6-polyprenyl-1,4-benzoquinol methylase/phosphoethanolamine N-methyltransferase